MGPKKSLVEVTHDEGYGDSLLLHINNAFGGKDMRAEKIVASATAASKIEGIPEGWELVRVGVKKEGDYFIDTHGNISEAENDSVSEGWAIIRKTEKPKQYRPFVNAAEYIAKRVEGFVALDWKDNTIAPGFHAVVSANEPFCWVAFGTIVERFEWGQAFKKLEFRHVDGSTTPFGVEVTE